MLLNVQELKVQHRSTITQLPIPRCVHHSFNISSVPNIIKMQQPGCFDRVAFKGKESEVFIPKLSTRCDRPLASILLQIQPDTHIGINIEPP